MTIWLSLALARFLPKEPPKAPVHWLKLELTETVRIFIDNVTIGTAKDFSELMNLAMPQKLLENRPDTVLALIKLSSAEKAAWSKDVEEILVLQSSWVNEFLAIALEWEKTKKWKCLELKDFDVFDHWTGPEILTESVHYPVNNNGSRTAYGLREVEE